MNNDTVYRQAAIDAVCQGWCELNHCECKYPFDPKQHDDYFCDGCYDVETLKALPSAQLEINTSLYSDGFDDGYKQAQNDIGQDILIRCKDCENWERINKKQGICDIWSDMEDGMTRYTDICGYCYMAERRTNEPDYIFE